MEVAAAAASASAPSALSVPHHAKKPKISLEDTDGNNEDLLPPLELKAQLLAAYDHSDLCNSVFYHNHVNYLSSDPSSIIENESTHTRLDENGINSNINSSDHDQKHKNKKNKQKQKLLNKKYKQYKTNQTPIERLTLSTLTSHSADIWCMSPPCQPHTRQHTNQSNEKDDPRSASFLHLCELLGDMDEDVLPELILLENVVGFELGYERDRNMNMNDDDTMDVEKETSEDGDNAKAMDGWGTNDKAQQKQQQKQQSPTTKSKDNTGSEKNNNSSSSTMGSFQTFRQTLSNRNYRVGHFHLDPTHVGIPNTRPRHYTVAVRSSSSSSDEGDTFLERLRKKKQSKKMEDENVGASNGGDTKSSPNKPVVFLKAFLTKGQRYNNHLFHKESIHDPPMIQDETSLRNVGIPVTTSKEELPLINNFLDANLPPNHNNANNGSSAQTSSKHTPATNAQTSTSSSSLLSSLQIPIKIRTSSSAWCFDIATPYHRHTSCFTHSYGKFVKGTGSILYTGPLLLSPSSTGAQSTTASATVETMEAIATTTNDEPATSDNIPSLERFELASPEDRKFDASWSNDLDWENDMRYFSGREIARLMGFPVAVEEEEGGAVNAAKVAKAAACNDDENDRRNNGDDSNTKGDHKDGDGGGDDDAVKGHRKFTFPAECTMKQQWKLLGNSINVHVAACVAEIGIQSILSKNNES